MGIGCASGTNPYFHNKQTLGLLGGAGGATGGAILCKNCKGVAKVAAIGGGALLGYLLGHTAGSYFDRKDQDRQVALINNVLENNPDNVTSSASWNKQWKNPNTGNTENHQVTSSVTPRRTYQQYANNHYRSSDVEPLNKQFPHSSGRQLQTCREFTIDLKISKELLGTQQDTKTQYYNGCRQQNGWRMIQ